MVQTKETMSSVEQAEDVAVELREAVLELKSQLNARFVGQELIIDQVLAVPPVDMHCSKADQAWAKRCW